MGAVIIVGFLVAMILTGVTYYIVIPYAYNIKGFFEDKVDDPRSIAFGRLLYQIIGIFPLLFLGAIFLNSYQKSTRQHSADQFGG
jgi:hypothetical protein